MKSRPTASGRRAGLAALAALPLLAACGDAHLERFPQTTFAPTTEMARIQDWLFHYTMWMGIVVGLAVFAVMAYILWRFRYRPGMPEPAQVHGNTRLEIAWTLIPSIIVALIAVPTVRGIFATQPVAPEDALQVRVIGKQWWWEFQYVVGTDTIVTANEIHVPVGTTVELLLESDNVLHSFWVPQMGGKRDLVPNRLNRLVFTPEQPGVYLGACAEFCGDSHALMQMRLIAQTPEGFQDWLRNEASPAVEPTDSASAVFLGMQLVTQGQCIGCHAIRGTNAIGRTGPDLTHFGRRRTVAAGILPNNAENLAAWLRDSPALKPGSLMPKMDYSEEEISYMVAYLQSLQ
jgi:cytochrome c oxidase subunit II